jgi:uracil-DNA glycosylase family 4
MYVTHAAFNGDCRLCPRLAGFLDEVRVLHPTYHARPVAPFGDPKAAFLVVGLAPGMHGANRTGRPFTGDYAGVLLYEALYRSGFSNQSQGDQADDGLVLFNCRISNAVKCLPPQNKPTPAEMRICNTFLANELAAQGAPRVLLVLGKIAHDAVLLALGLKASRYPFGHANQVVLPDGRTLISSYHCSRYNTQTKRLTPEMFYAVMHQARAAVDALHAVEV